MPPGEEWGLSSHGVPARHRQSRGGWGEGGDLGLRTPSSGRHMEINLYLFSGQERRPGWNAWHCEGGQHRNLILESMDGDWLARRYAPVAVGVTSDLSAPWGGYVGMYTGPGTTDTGMVQAFWTVGHLGKRHNVYFASTNPGKATELGNSLTDAVQGYSTSLPIAVMRPPSMTIVPFSIVAPETVITLPALMTRLPSPGRAKARDAMLIAATVWVRARRIWLGHIGI